MTFYSFTILNNVFGFMLWHYIIVKNVTSVEKIKGVFLVLVISHVLIIFLNPQVVLDLSTRTYIYGNPYMGDGNDFSLSICIVIPMAIFLLQTTQRKYMKVIYIIAIVYSPDRYRGHAISRRHLGARNGVFLFMVVWAAKNSGCNDDRSRSLGSCHSMPLPNISTA